MIDKVKRILGLSPRKTGNKLVISVEKLDSLAQVIVEFEKYDWQAQTIIEDIEKNGSLKARLQLVSDVLSRTLEEVEARKKEKINLTQQIADAESRIRELESTEVNVKTRLSQIQQELHSNCLRAELVETLFGILHNPAMVGYFRLAAMKEKLSQVLKARQGMQGFPINYDRMRDEMIFLVQTVLGSFLVPRQTVDEEIGRLRNELTDLKLDRLGKLEKDRISFNKEKDEFIRFEHEFATFATAILCKMAVGMVKQGKIGLMICDKCRLVFACPEFRRTGYASRSGCPRCYGSSRQLSTAVLERRLKERESIESC